MDQRRFDAWIRDVASAESRRSVLAKLAQGGLAALLAAVGLTTLDGESAEAAHCRRRCRRHARRRSRRHARRRSRRRCLRKCRAAHLQ